MTPRRYTAELLKAQAQGATIVCSWQPFEGRKMEFSPRKKGDPQPWLVTGTRDEEWRYNGRDCHAMKDGKVYVAISNRLMRPLTDVQREVLHALHNHDNGAWHPGCGWVWGNHSTTAKHLESLAKKGFVEVVSREKYKESYVISEAGREEYRKQFSSITDDLNEKTDEMVEWIRENEASAILVDDLTVWTWHDFTITLQDAQRDGTVRFSVATKGIRMPLVLDRAPNREDAIRVAARSVIARTMKRAGISS